MCSAQNYPFTLDINYIFDLVTLDTPVLSSLDKTRADIIKEQ